MSRKPSVSVAIPVPITATQYNAVMAAVKQRGYVVKSLKVPEKRMLIVVLDTPTLEKLPSTITADGPVLEDKAVIFRNDTPIEELPLIETETARDLTKVLQSESPKTEDDFTPPTFELTIGGVTLREVLTPEDLQLLNDLVQAMGE